MFPTNNIEMKAFNKRIFYIKYSFHMISNRFSLKSSKMGQSGSRIIVSVRFISEYLNRF
jgi:hypothetical protein